jgi:hypothetical protein
MVLIKRMTVPLPEQSQAEEEGAEAAHRWTAEL